MTKDQLLLLHLLKFNHQQNEIIVSELITEQGIKRTLNCTLGLVSRLLKKNEEEGYIYRTKSKIINGKMKQNVFFLTDEGLKRAMEISKMVANSHLKNNLNLLHPNDE